MNTQTRRLVASMFMLLVLTIPATSILNDFKELGDISWSIIKDNYFLSLRALFMVFLVFKFMSMFFRSLDVDPEEFKKLSNEYLELLRKFTEILGELPTKNDEKQK